MCFGQGDKFLFILVCFGLVLRQDGNKGRIMGIREEKETGALNQICGLPPTER